MPGVRQENEHSRASHFPGDSIPSDQSAKAHSCCPGWGSGAGKTTIAESLMRLTKIALVPLDDFYQTVIPESEWPHKTVEQRLNGVFDWSRVRSEALEPLRAGRPGRWHAFDFMRGLGKEETYSLKKEVTEVTPAPTILIEGAYSAL